MTADDKLTPAARALRDEYPGIWYWEDDRWTGPLGVAIQAEAIEDHFHIGSNQYAAEDAAAIAAALKEVDHD